MENLNQTQSHVGTTRLISRTQLISTITFFSISVLLGIIVYIKEPRALDLLGFYAFGLFIHAVAFFLSVYLRPKINSTRYLLGHVFAYLSLLFAILNALIILSDDEYAGFAFILTLPALGIAVFISIMFLLIGMIGRKTNSDQFVSTSGDLDNPNQTGIKTKIGIIIKKIFISIGAIVIAILISIPSAVFVGMLLDGRSVREALNISLGVYGFNVKFPFIWTDRMIEHDNVKIEFKTPGGSRDYYSPSGGNYDKYGWYKIYIYSDGFGGDDFNFDLNIGDDDRYIKTCKICYEGYVSGDKVIYTKTKDSYSDDDYSYYNKYNFLLSFRYNEKNYHLSFRYSDINSRYKETFYSEEEMTDIFERVMDSIKISS